MAIGVAAFWVLLFAPPLFMTPPAAYSGVRLIRTGALVQPNLIHVDNGSPAYRAGLRTGHVLRCLSRRDLVLLTTPLPHGYLAGTLISACVQHNGRSRIVRFAIHAGPPVENIYGSNILSALRLAVALLFLVTAVLLVMGRPSLMTWIFYVFCLGSAPAISAAVHWTILPSWQYAIVSATLLLSGRTTSAFLLLFAIMVPDEAVPPGWRRRVFYFAAVAAAAYVVFASITLFVTDFTFSPPILGVLNNALTVGTVLVVFARLLVMRPLERARFGWAAFAIIFGVLADDLRGMFAVTSTPALAALGNVAAYLTAVMPLALMYAILRRHVIDVRFVISRAVVYAVLTSAVVLVIGVVDWATSAYLNQTRIALALDALITIALGFVLHRTYAWIESAVDFVLFRKKHDAETYLHRLARTLPFSESVGAIEQALVEAPCEKLELTGAALYRDREGIFVPAACARWTAAQLPPLRRDHEVARFLMAERTRFHIDDLHSNALTAMRIHGAEPALGVPIFEGNTLAGFTIYGLHRDGTKLDPDEEAVLEHLCEIAAQAYTSIELARYRAAALAMPIIRQQGAALGDAP